MTQQDNSLTKIASGIMLGLSAVVAFFVFIQTVNLEKPSNTVSNVSEWIKPAGQVNLDSTSIPITVTAIPVKSAKDIYQSTCKNCHETGVIGAPMLSDKTSWDPRIAKGHTVLFQNAINGFNAMPPRGGQADLSDEEIKQTVQYMLDILSIPQKTAQEIYESTCKNCHETGVIGAPMLSDKTSWESRIAQGETVLIQHAIKGFNAMPPRGGHADLTDNDIKKTIHYMISTVQLNTKPEQEAPELSDTVVSTEETASVPPSSDDNIGEKLYNTVCAVCHNISLMGAPKLGDKENWAPRIAQGTDTLLSHALEGFQGKIGVMPPKGGNTTLSDEEVKAAVMYMISHGQ